MNNRTKTNGPAISSRRNFRRHGCRCGSAIIELVIVMPVLFLMVFGSIGLNQSIFLKQTLTSAAHDGTLIGLRIGASEQDVIDRIEMLLQDRGVTAEDIYIDTASGTPFDSLDGGGMFTVVIVAEPSQNNLFIALTDVDVQITGVKP